MSFDVSKYIQKKIKKRNCFDFLRYCYLKSKRKHSELNEIFKSFCLFVCKILGGFLLLIVVIFIFLSILDWYQSNYKYSIAMPKITGYFIKREDGFTASGLYTISQKEKDKGEKSASLLYGSINCYYKERFCKEELVQVINIGGVFIYPYIEEYDITYIDKNRVIYSDRGKNSVVVDLNQETITKTIYKTFLQETPKHQIDEFLTNQEEILKEEKRVIKKYLKKKFW